MKRVRQWPKEENNSQPFILVLDKYTTQTPVSEFSHAPAIAGLATCFFIYTQLVNPS